ncbi:MAG: hypothetical protein WA110_04655 [Anaerolineaceae bacterium]
MTNKTSSTTIILIIVVVLLICIGSICLLATVGGTLLGRLGINTGTTQQSFTTPTPPAWPTSVTGLNDNLTTNQYEHAYESLNTLVDEIVPINDPVDLAERLGGKSDVSSTLTDPDAPYEVGDRKSFWVTNTDTNDNFQVEAVLRYRGENIYFWIEKGVNYDPSDLKELADTFDQQIIPTNREFFGMEWNPGVDGDPRFYVLYTPGLGSDIAGYFSSADEVHPDAHPYSNAHEMFLMNSDTVGLSENYIYGTMAHEFQHMIHWYQDRNEETWVNEGFSMLAEHVNEYDAGGFDYDYMNNPDLQLTDWNGDTGENGPHYGASYLFMVYFLDRFGEDATKALVAQKENGFASLDKVMQELNIINPTTNQVYTAEEVFTDWTLANYLQDPSFDNGRYSYKTYSPSDVTISQEVNSCPDHILRDVYQYGVNYIEIDCPGAHTLTFTGTQAVNILPFSVPASGEYFFWSNMGDESNMSLTQTFDLGNVSGPAALTFKTWYDLEQDYDYVFASASTDGVNWDILRSENCTTDNSSGNSYGCGWNGTSNGWIDESLDLSAYAGSKVTIRFDYVTDAAVNGKGMALDDFSIAAIDYHNDLEGDMGGWEADGFVRLQNMLPQTYSVSLISMGKNLQVQVVPLSQTNTAEIQFEINRDVEKVILVVSGTTPITREKAVYQTQIQ